MSQIGAKEAALRAQREARFHQTHHQPERAMKKAIATKALKVAQGKPPKSRGKKRGRKTKATAKTAQAAKSGPAGPRKSRTEALIEMLNIPGGVTCAQIEAEFGWKPHSVRAAISRIDLVQKKKDKARGGTVYRMPPPIGA